MSSLIIFFVVVAAGAGNNSFGAMAWGGESNERTTASCHPPDSDIDEASPHTVRMQSCAAVTKMMAFHI